MSEMIDRVAKAICRAEIGSIGPYGFDLEETGQQSAAHWRSLARAAIAAMREPTQVMLDAGWDSRSVPRYCWENMIDEALK